MYINLNAKTERKFSNVELIKSLFSSLCYSYIEKLKIGVNWDVPSNVCGLYNVHPTFIIRTLREDCMKLPNIEYFNIWIATNNIASIITVIIYSPVTHSESCVIAHHFP